MSTRLYTVEFAAVGVTAQQDLFSITAADDKPVSIAGLFLAQSSDVADAAEEMLHYRIIRGHATVGSGGSAPTPRPIDASGAASGFTARVNDTTIASAGTAVNLLSDAFNIRAGLQVWFPPEFWIETNQTNGLLVVRLLTTPADSLTMYGSLFLAEAG